MKSAPQMLQLLREINDLVSFAAGSSCSMSQDLWLDWCQCQSAFTVPALHQRQSPWAAALLSQDHWRGGNLQKRSSPGLGQQPVRLFGTSDSKGPKSHPVTWSLGDQCSSALEWGMPCSRSRAPADPILNPDTTHLMSPSQTWNPTLVAVPQIQVYFLSSWATGFPLCQIPWFLQRILLTKCEGFPQVQLQPLGYGVVPDLCG